MRLTPPLAAVVPVVVALGGALDDDFLGERVVSFTTLVATAFLSGTAAAAGVATDCWVFVTFVCFFKMSGMPARLGLRKPKVF